MHKEIICWRHRICIVPKSDFKSWLHGIIFVWILKRPKSFKTHESITYCNWIDIHKILFQSIVLQRNSQNSIYSCSFLACCDFVVSRLISFYAVIFWIFNLVSILRINKILWIHILQALRRHKRESRRWLNRKSVRVIYNSIKYLRGKTFKTLYFEIELNSECTRKSASLNPLKQLWKMLEQHSRECILYDSSELQCNGPWLWSDDNRWFVFMDLTLIGIFLATRVFLSQSRSHCQYINDDL